MFALKKTCTGRSENGRQRKSRARDRRSRLLLLEQLEQRALMTLGFGNLSSGIASQLDQAETYVANRVAEAAAPLPIIGQSIRSVIGDAASQLASNRGMFGALEKSAESLARTAPETDQGIRDLLYQHLVGLLKDTNGNGFVEPGDIVVSSNAATGDLAITVSLQQSLNTSSRSYNFALGLPGIPFQVNGSTRVQAFSTAALDRVTYGLRNNVFYAESPLGNSFRIDVGASLDSAFTGTFGFFRAEVSPRVPNGIALAAQLRMDAHGFQLSNPTLAGNAIADLQFVTSMPIAGPTGGRLGLPNFQFNLYMNWPLDGVHHGADIANLGSNPIVELRNVRFGLGTYLSSVVKPITDNLYRAFEPLIPVFDMLDDPIPGLTDLTESAGLGETSIESVIKLVTPYLSPDLQLASTVVTTLVDVGQALNVIQNDPNGREIFIGVGDLSLSNTNGDARRLAAVNFAAMTAPDFTKLSQLVVPLQTGLKSVRERIGEIPGPFGDLLRRQFDRLDREILKLENGAGYELPIIDNPTSLFRLLLGEDVDLITFKAVFHADASVTRVIPFWGPIGARFNGTVGFDGFLRAGYDTYGLRQFLSTGARDRALLGNGLYFDSSRELIRFNGAISGGAAVSVPIGFVPIGFIPVQIFAVGSINGSLRLRGENGGDHLTIRFVDGKLDNGANKVRVFEAGELNGSLFAVQGELVTDLNFTVDVGPLIGPSVTVFETGVTSPHVLLTTADLNTTDPFENLTSVPNEVPQDLVVDMLAFHDGGDGGDDSIIVRRVFNHLGTPFIEVQANGDRRAIEREDLVLNVVINGSADVDNVTIYDVSRPVIVDGRGGALNSLAYDDRARLGERRTLEYAIGDSFINVGRGNQRYSSVTYANVTSLFVTLNGNGRINRVSIPSISVPTTIQGGEAGDRFVIGDATHSLQWMRGLLKILGGGGFDTIEFNDTANIASADIVLGWYLDPTRGDAFVSRRGLQWTSVAKIPAGPGEFVRAATPITRRMIFKDIEHIYFFGGPNGNIVTVQDSFSPLTPPSERVPMSLSISQGAGDDETQIRSNTGRVSVDGGGGDDVVTIGDPLVGTDLLAGDLISFSNPTGTVTLAVDNSAGVTPRNIGLRMDGDRGSVHGLGATVRFDARELIGLEIRAGRSNDRIDVYDTPRNVLLRPLRILQTRILTGDGWDEVHVHRTTGPLIVNANGVFDFTSIASDRGLDSYTGSITVNGGRLFIDDSRSAASRNFTLTENSLIDQRLTSLQFDELAALTINASSRGNQFIVAGAPATTLSTALISTGAGDDHVHVQALRNPLRIDLGGGIFDGLIVGGPGLSLDAIQGDVFVQGTAAAGFLRVDDSGETDARDVIIDPREISFDGRPRIRLYDGFYSFRPRDFRFTGGSGDDQIYVYGDPNTADAILDPGPGDDYVFFGSADHRLSNLGNFGVFDSEGIDTLFLGDTGETQSQSYTYDRAIFQRITTTGTQVSFNDNIELVAVSGGSGDNRWNVSQLPRSTLIEFIGGAGDERFNGPDSAALWQIVDSVGRHAVVSPSDPDHGVVFSHIEHLQGGAGDDVFYFEPDAVPVAGNLHGGGGVNTLDYSSFKTDVYVNLQTDQADLIVGETRAMQRVVGGQGNDILVGSGGNELLGMAGRDLLIAGAASSVLRGGDGEDILVGGVTDYDRSRSQLAAIRNLWAIDNLDYATRAARLMAENGAPALAAENVRGNGLDNQLLGEDGRDLFFASLGSADTDRVEDEIFARL